MAECCRRVMANSLPVVGTLAELRHALHLSMVDNLLRCELCWTCPWSDMHVEFPTQLCSVMRTAIDLPLENALPEKRQVPAEHSSNVAAIPVVGTGGSGGDCTVAELLCTWQLPMAGILAKQRRTLQLLWAGNILAKTCATLHK